MMEMSAALFRDRRIVAAKVGERRISTKKHAVVLNGAVEDQPAEPEARSAVYIGDTR